jgi:hypothetical protein
MDCCTYHCHGVSSSFVNANEPMTVAWCMRFCRTLCSPKIVSPTALFMLVLCHLSPNCHVCTWRYVLSCVYVALARTVSSYLPDWPESLLDAAEAGRYRDPRAVRTCPALPCPLAHLICHLSLARTKWKLSGDLAVKGDYICFPFVQSRESSELQTNGHRHSAPSPLHRIGCLSSSSAA